MGVQQLGGILLIREAGGEGRQSGPRKITAYLAKEVHLIYQEALPLSVAQADREMLVLLVVVVLALMPT